MPTLSSNTTGADASGVCIRESPMQVPFALANKAFHEPSLEAVAAPNDTITKSDARDTLVNILLPFTFRTACL